MRFEVLEAITSFSLIIGWFFLFRKYRMSFVKNKHKIKYYELIFLLVFVLALIGSSIAVNIHDTLGYDWKRIILFLLFIEKGPEVSIARTFGYVLLAVCLTMLYGKIFFKDDNSDTG